MHFTEQGTVTSPHQDGAYKIILMMMSGELGQQPHMYLKLDLMNIIKLDDFKHLKKSSSLTKPQLS